MRAIATVVFAALAAVQMSPARAQWLNYPTPGVPRLPDGRPNLTAPPPRTAEGTIDLSGLWEPDPSGGEPSSFGGGVVTLPAEFQNVAARVKGGLPYRPWALDVRKAREADNGKDNPDGLCLPLSLLQLHSHPFPRRIMQLPGIVAILYEKDVDYRQMFTDGRPLPVDPQPSYFGYSSGKWEGDTLVIRTSGFREGLWADGAGNPLTEAAIVTERFRRSNFGTLEIEVTVDDTKAYTAPWTMTLRHRIKLDTELLEYVCLENDKAREYLLRK